MSIKETVKGYLVQKQNRRYQSAYTQKRNLACYDATIRLAEEQEKNSWMKQVAGRTLPVCRVIIQDFATSPFLSDREVEDEEIILLVQSSGRLSDDALFYVKAWFSLYPDTWLLYGDEDVVDLEGNRKEPWLKPAWSPDLFLSNFYLGAVIAIQGKQWNSFFTQESTGEISVYELCLKLLEAAGGFQRKRPNLQIGHVDAILFHHSANIEGKVSHMPEEVIHPSSSVSIIIPSKDQPEILERNLHSLYTTIFELPYEVIIVDNGSTEENRNKIASMIQRLEAQHISCKYLYQPMPFHFSKMCNLGAEEATGDLLLFLNDDVEAIQAGWLGRMVERAQREYVGAVGAKLLYPDSDQIQHAGIVNLPRGPVHKLQFLDDREEYLFGRNRMEVNVSAVTGACLMMRKELFWECGGFALDLPVAYNDVDLCFTVLEKGYYNVVMNSISFFHHESLSRGSDETSEQQKRLREEQQRLYHRHEAFRGRDPFYHKWLNQSMTDMGVDPVPGEELPTRLRITRKALTKEVRLHPGVYLRIASIEDRRLEGIALMLGDDNACYSRRLVFAPAAQEEESLSQTIYEARTEEMVSYPERTFYMAKLPGQLRLDMERNMSEQTNVGLAGILVDVTELPPGEYTIGVLLKNKVTRVTYLNWSARRWMIQ